MYVGHYGVAIALAAVRPRPRALTCLAFAAVAPDLPGLLLESISPGTLAMTHGWGGLGVMTLVAVAVTAGLRLEALHVCLAAIAVLSHSGLDTFARAIDGHPWIDFAVEAALLVGGAALYAARAPLSPPARRYSRVLVAALLAFQLAWDALVSVAPALA